MESGCLSVGLLMQLRRAVRTSREEVKQPWVMRKMSMKSSPNLRGVVNCWKSFSMDAAAICVCVWGGGGGGGGGGRGGGEEDG